MNLIMLLSLTVANGPGLPSTFDLNCDATKSVESWRGPERTRISEERVGLLLRVDLARKLWCSGDCATTSPIASVDGSMILFQKKEGSGGDDLTLLNRSTGEYLDRDRIFVTPNDSDIVVTRTSGSCKPAVFSGFPASKL
jgi:hypothetical protein